jgi:hypothetical protein
MVTGLDVMRAMRKTTPAEEGITDREDNDDELDNDSDANAHASPHQVNRFKLAASKLKSTVFTTYSPYSFGPPLH